MFGCGWYKIQWLNKNNEVTKEKEEYLTAQKYHQEVMEMQTAFLQGFDVVKMNVKFIEKKIKK